MGDVKDVSHLIVVNAWKHSILPHNKEYAELPLCQTASDFLKYHKVISSGELSKELRKELLEQMQRLFDLISEASQAFLQKCGVSSVSELTDDQRHFYYKILRDVLDKEDHYP